MAHSKNVLFIIDPIDSLEPGHDTSLGLMEAAIKNGDRVFITTPKNLVIASDGDASSVYAVVQEVTSFVQQQYPPKNKLVSVPIIEESMANMVLDHQPGTSTGNDFIAAPCCCFTTPE